MALPEPDTYASNKMRLYGIMRSQISHRERCLQAWATILLAEVSAGTKFLITKPEGNPYAVLGHTKQLTALPRMGRGGDRIFSYLSQFYGLNEHEDITRFVYDSLRSFTLTHGNHVELRRFSAYDEATQTTYLHDYAGHIWKLVGDEPPTLVPNGEDDVFFVHDDGGVHADVTPEDIAPHGLLVDALTNLNFTNGLGGITPEQQRRAMMIWIFCLALPDLMPTKPLLMIEGAQGSGKSHTVQIIQLALMGAAKPMILTKSKEDAFGILLLRSPIAVFDNTDSYIDWVADQICAYTTTGIFPRRKLYSDDEEVIIKPHAFVAVASKNPVSFRREDVADRSLIIRLERRTGFTRAAKLKQEIIASRPKLLGEYLWFVNEIIREIRAGALADGPTDELHRMADFAAIGRVVAKVLNWEEGAVEEVMMGLQAERDAFANEEDPLIDLLHQWIVYRPRLGPSNIGREVNVTTLFHELETLAQAQGIEKTWYKSPRMLAQKIRSPHILRDFDIESINGDGHKTYRIRRKNDPKLGVIEGGISESNLEVIPGGYNTEEL